MVTSVTNLSRSGLYDWMAQRVSAVVLAAYFIFLIGYLSSQTRASAMSNGTACFPTMRCESSVCWPL